jgi:3-hydroxyisobutyrate dehydrogenase-like beta-hydroxyacid dehydrogenase
MTRPAVKPDQYRYIGFVGLGVIGRALARRVLDGGVPVGLISRHPDQVVDLLRDGAKEFGSPAALARASKAIVVVVRETSEFEAALFGDDGVAAGAHFGMLVLAVGTYSPASVQIAAKRFAGLGVDLVDAPVSGGVDAAKTGSLSVMVGGSVDAVSAALPLLCRFSDRIVHVGPVGSGQIAKMCNQLVVGSTLEAVAEALSLALAAGVDARKVRDAMLGGFAASRVLEVHGQRMLDEDFAPGAELALLAKDAHIVIETADALGLPITGFRPVATALDRMVELGLGDRDFSALINLQRAFPRRTDDVRRSKAGARDTA